jgi:acyl carrier protein
MREDSIRRAMEARELVYGPPSMLRMSIAEELRQIAADSKDRAIGYIQEDITYWITRKFNITDATIGPDTDLTKDLKLDFEQLQILRDEIEENYGVQISDDMLKRLNTLDRLTKFIVEVVKPIEE